MTADCEALAQQLTRLLGLMLVFAYYDVAFEILDILERRGLPFDGGVAPLREEVGRLAACSTAYVQRRAADRVVSDEVLASTTRDPRQFD